MAGLPPSAGLSFKPEHRAAIADGAPEVGFFEVHAENYMVAGGPRLRMLEEVRARWPLSLHGIGLSIGGEGRLDCAHLARLRALVERFRPASFSEHLAWSSHEGVWFGDLLPFAYDGAALARVSDHVAEAQEALGLRLLLENPSAYVALGGGTMGEIEFLAEVAARTGCGLLLDLNNVFVSAANLGFDAAAYLDAFPVDLVGEVHLAGHAFETAPEGGALLLDAHDRQVSAPVWALYDRFLRRAGPRPTLVEWDASLPPFETFRDEARRVGAALRRAAEARDAA